MQAAPQGVFVQPPASGTVFGPQNRTEVEGFGLTFPEVNLRMPTLRFPSVQRSRRNARMELDRATAPFMEQAAPSFASAPAAPSLVAAAPAMMAAPSAAPSMMMAPSAPTMMMAAPSAAPTMMMAAPSYAPAMPMMQFAPQYVPMAPQAPQAPSAPRAPEAPSYGPPACGPPRAPDCEAPRGPACGPYGQLGAPTAQPYANVNARLRELEATERRIDQKLSQLQSSLSELHHARDARPGPARPIGAEVKPVVARPIGQPTSSVSAGREPYRTAGADYNEPRFNAQPATYHADQAVETFNSSNELSQPIRQPSQVIRQPATSQGRIVGIAPRG